MARPALEIADIFRGHGPAWRKANAGHVSLGQLKVMAAIESCRTAALGGHVMRCEDCLHTQIAYNSRCNRHCPAPGPQALAWMKERKSELLDVPYFHIVFTLPAQGLPPSPTRTRLSSTISCSRLPRRQCARLRPIPPRRQDRLHLSAPHLGLRDDPSSTRPHDRAGWWDIARRHALIGCRPNYLFASEGAVAAVPPPGCWRCSPHTTPAACSSSATTPTSPARPRSRPISRRCIGPSGSSIASSCSCRAGESGLSVPLHPPGRDRQQPPHRRRDRRHVQLLLITGSRDPAAATRP